MTGDLCSNHPRNESHLFFLAVVERVLRVAVDDGTLLVRFAHVIDDRHAALLAEARTGRQPLPRTASIRAITSL